jgi:hypothetical protein
VVIHQLLLQHPAEEAGTKEIKAHRLLPFILGDMETDLLVDMQIQFMD